MERAVSSHVLYGDEEDSVQCLYLGWVPDPSRDPLSTAHGLLSMMPWCQR
jgi:hypothetical protein